ncbi:recombinase family protein [Roseovarius nanhaiticus]|uniref:recombinase family protein n=1 Tax=Roseovarius nanhaiticus TaxID=573024 RepID=UPI002491C52D|nr:recombinase family protein [Roseovarius nanhaiticus]
MHNKKMVFGYKRVSTDDQSFNRQDLGTVDRVFQEKRSGGTRARPELERMLDFVREGDEIVVHSIDRLARDMFDLLEIVRDLRERGVTIRFIKENLAFNGEQENPMEKLQFHLMSAFAEFERAIIRERQKEGITKAKAAGKYNGRPPSDHTQVKELLEKTDLPIGRIAQETGFSRGTIYKVMKEFNMPRAQLRILYKHKLEVDSSVLGTS